MTWVVKANAHDSCRAGAARGLLYPIYQHGGPDPISRSLSSWVGSSFSSHFPFDPEAEQRTAALLACRTGPEGEQKKARHCGHRTRKPLSLHPAFLSAFPQHLRRNVLQLVSNLQGEELLPLAPILIRVR